jgi:hypothetical protein
MTPHILVGVNILGLRVDAFDLVLCDHVINFENFLYVMEHLQIERLVSLQFFCIFVLGIFIILI